MLWPGDARLSLLGTTGLLVGQGKPLPSPQHQKTRFWDFKGGGHLDHVVLRTRRGALQKKPEDINRRSADMWSFAVLLWELVTREVPFADLSNMEIGMKVALEGLRPTIPPGISPHICKLMKICMNEDPAKRPKFDMIVPILEKMQDK
ncbi:UNVERIFIED_CONTAM: hypothetical protein FKN15_007790 [Acipenser sinensis]